MFLWFWGSVFSLVRSRIISQITIETPPRRIRKNRPRPRPPPPARPAAGKRLVLRNAMNTSPSMRHAVRRCRKQDEPRTSLHSIKRALAGKSWPIIPPLRRLSRLLASKQLRRRTQRGRCTAATDRKLETEVLAFCALGG